MKKFISISLMLLMTVLSYSQETAMLGDTMNLNGQDFVVVGFDTTQVCLDKLEPRLQKVKQPKSECISCAKESTNKFKLPGSVGTKAYVVQVARNKIKQETVPYGCRRVRVGASCYIIFSKKLHKTSASAQLEADQWNKKHPEMDTNESRAFVVEWTEG